MLTLGAATAGLVAVLAALGHITGGGPEEKDRRELEKSTRVRPEYSLRLPGTDTYLGYNRLDPLGQRIGLVADWVRHGVEVLRHGEGVEDWATAAMALSIAYTDNITSKSYAEGVAQLIDLLFRRESDPDTRLSKSKRFANQLLSGVVVPTGLAGLEQALDPTLSEVKGVLDTIRSKLPGTEKVDRLNALGDPYTTGSDWSWLDLVSPVSVQTARTDPVAEELLRLGMPVSRPSKYLLPAQARGHGLVADALEIYPAEYHRLLTIMTRELTDDEGRPLREALLARLATDAYREASEGPYGGKARHLRLVLEHFKEAAKAQFIAENEPEDAPHHAVVAALRQRQRLRQLQQAPPGLAIGR
jgi:hypothetical protein